MMKQWNQVNGNTFTQHFIHWMRFIFCLLSFSIQSMSYTVNIVCLINTLMKAKSKKKDKMRPDALHKNVSLKVFTTQNFVFFFFLIKMNQMILRTMSNHIISVFKLHTIRYDHYSFIVLRHHIIIAIVTLMCSSLTKKGNKQLCAHQTKVIEGKKKEYDVVKERKITSATFKKCHFFLSHCLSMKFV